MSRPDVAAIRAALEKATPGLDVDEVLDGGGNPTGEYLLVGPDPIETDPEYPEPVVLGSAHSRADAHLIASAPTWLSALCDALEAAERERDELARQLGVACEKVGGYRTRAEAAEARVKELEGEIDDIDSYLPELYEVDEDGEPNEDRPIPLVERAQDAGEARAKLAAAEAREAGLRAYVEGDAYCPCCEETRACLRGCTLADDCPDKAESVGAARAALAQPERSSVPPATPEGWDPQGNEAPDAPVYDPDRDPATLRDLLSLVEDMFDRPLPSVEEIAGWDDATHDAVSDWAASVHLRANDHDDVEVPPLPAVLNQPEDDRSREEG